MIEAERARRHLLVVAAGLGSELPLDDAGEAALLLGDWVGSGT